MKLHDELITRATGLSDVEKGLGSIAFIRLMGHPYEQSTLMGETVSCTDALDRLAIRTSYRERLKQAVGSHAEDLGPLRELGFHGLDALIKSPTPLTFEQAFSLATMVCLSSNTGLHEILGPEIPGYASGLVDPKVLQLHGVSLLQGMSVREAIQGLEPQEIAGMVAATLDLDTVYRAKSPDGEPVFAIGGMGGDRGLRVIGKDNSKLFSVSTLAALVLSEFFSVHKHHSYPNTSKVAGQSAIESFGARSDFDSGQQIDDVMRTSGILMSSCHSTRTLHTISHALKGETINHVLGPLAIPHDPKTELCALIGVNHNVHPQTVISALEILMQREVQRYGNSVAFCGLEMPLHNVPDTILEPLTYYSDSKVKPLVVLDEVPPPPLTTMAAFLVGGKTAGTFLISPEDFMGVDEAEKLAADGLLIPNERGVILDANEAVVRGSDGIKAKYVAMTVALGLFTQGCSHLPGALDTSTHRVNKEMLSECYSRALNSIMSGSLEQKLGVYVEATQRDSLPGIDTVIVDLDNCLIKPADPDFYRQYGEAVNRAVASYHGVSVDRGREIADEFRMTHGGGEHALLSDRTGRGIEILYDEMCTIRTAGQFSDNRPANQLIQILRRQGKRVVALTDSPEDLSRRALAEAGINTDTDFDLYVPFTRKSGPRKIMDGMAIFSEVLERLGVSPEKVLAVGDSLVDVKPASELGMKTFLVKTKKVDGYDGPMANTFLEVFTNYRNSL